jgi:hypothetical protein
MVSKKRVHLQQFGIIQLQNPDLTYNRNPEREQNYYCNLPPPENQES